MLTLPFDVIVPAPVHHFGKPAKRSKRPLALVVEDEDESEILMEKSIRAFRNGMGIKWVKSAEEAEKLLKENAYDFVIADHYLQGKETGLQLWKTCKERYHDTPFLLTSAIDLEQYAQLMADESDKPFFLHKPYQLTEASSMLEKLWDRDLSYGFKYENLGLQAIIVLFIVLAPMMIQMSGVRSFKPVTLPHQMLPSEPVKTIVSPRKSAARQQTNLLQKILNQDLKSDWLLIRQRADDIIDSFGPPDLLFRDDPQTLPIKNDDFDGKFKKYLYLRRVG